ncbi:hypothetical protein MSEO_29690 [Mycobacterium seoulense]|uniref:Uncharacterized protein n=1 Tax=Mycobacterium seoulense TaxID=386911 RepID=A0A7I7P1S2_9MYCO|nr:hypothetical protein MSEO_29690 [Mycobacterium seoulense]
MTKETLLAKSRFTQLQIREQTHDQHVTGSRELLERAGQTSPTRDMRFAYLGSARIEYDFVLTAIEQPRHHRRTHLTDTEETDS